MLERDPKTLSRLQVIVTALIEHRISTSLVDVERKLACWRDGTCSMLAAHTAVLRHAARCTRTIERVTKAADAHPEGILRDAVDAGLMAPEEFVQLVGQPPLEVASADALCDDDNKRRTVEALLTRGPVLVHVDARRAEVSVPARFRADPSLVLRFGYGLSPAIVDLELDDEAVSGTLTFAGQPFRCVLPWTAVYAAVLEGEQGGTVWPEDIPEDVIADGEGTSGPAPAREEPAKLRSGHLKLVE
jgi:stringent starvation protein B